MHRIRPDHASATVRVDGVDLHYWTVGAEEHAPIVCLHATGHSAADFAATAGRLAGRLRWVALDWPAQGASTGDHMPASADRYAELLAGFLHATGIERPILLGNSIGGAAAIRLAAEHPDQVRALVLANPGGLVPVDATTRMFCRMMTAFFGAGARGAGWFGPLFAAYYRMVLRESTAATDRRRIVADGRRTAAVMAQAWASFAQPQADLREAFASLDCPVLLTWAKSDRILAFRRCRAAIERLPSARVVAMRGGHSAFLEDPKAFDATLVAFVDGLQAPAGSTPVRVVI